LGITYAHVPKATRLKLDDKAEKTIFIGYKHEGYKLYNPMTKKVIVSCDVTFVEDEECQWNATTEMDLKKRYIYVLNDDVEDEVTLEAPAAQPEAVIQPEVAAPIAAMMERPRRQQRQPVHLQDCEVNFDDEVNDNGDLVHFAFLADSKPVRLADAIQHPKWQEAMKEELMAIEKNNTWQLTDIPKGHKAIDVKWVYKINVKENGEIYRYKARLVAKGFEQREGYDHKEIFLLQLEWKQ